MWITLETNVAFNVLAGCHADSHRTAARAWRRHRRRIAANIRLGRGARCGAAKAYGCRHGRKSLTAGAVETLLEQKATLVPAASVTDGMGGLVRLKGTYGRC